tara:strand:- start:586 stop:804 length:219 start_codon:yes stop_codon:yes gene_type:complete
MDDIDKAKIAEIKKAVISTRALEKRTLDRGLSAVCKVYCEHCEFLLETIEELEKGDECSEERSSSVRSPQAE